MKEVPTLQVIEGGVRGPKYSEPSKPKSKRNPLRGMACPVYVKGRPRELWLKLIQPCGWLVAPFDEALGATTVILLAEFLENPNAMKAAKISVLLHLMRDCGLTPVVRRRLQRANPYPAAN